MQALFQTILYQPIFNGFVALYNMIPDVGVVIILITILIKVILYPLTNASIKAQKSLTDLQPKLDAVKQQFKDNQQQLAQETMKLYKEHKVNPFGSCLPILVQLPIFIALYYVLRDGLTTNSFDLLYPFVKSPGTINAVSLGLVDLGKGGNIILAVLAGAAQFWQAKMFSRKQPPKIAGAAAKDEGMAAMMNKQMLYVMPIMTVLISFQLPGGLALYWFFSTLLTGLQQVFLFKKSGQSVTV